MWLALTLAFEFTLGRFAFGYSWRRILEDYDISGGGQLLFSVVTDGLVPSDCMYIAMPEQLSAKSVIELWS